MRTDEAALIVSAAAGCVALYGAVNSHRALAWQRRRDQELRSVKLEILWAHRMDTVAHDRDARPREENRGYRLIVSIVNVSEQAVVYVSEVLMRSPTQVSGTYLQKEEPDVCLQPHERMSRMLWVDNHKRSSSLVYASSSTSRLPLASRSPRARACSTPNASRTPRRRSSCAAARCLRRTGR